MEAMETGIFWFYLGLFPLVAVMFAAEREKRGLRWFALSMALGAFGFSVWGVSLHKVSGLPENGVNQGMIVFVSLVLALVFIYWLNKPKDDER